MISALDHVALAVRDLDAAVQAYRRLLGREPNWIGGDGGARHAWFQLPDMALDVIAPQGEGAFGDTIRAHLDARGEGIWAIAFTTPDIEAAHARIASAGFDVSDVKTGRKPGTRVFTVRAGVAAAPALVIQQGAPAST